MTFDIHYAPESVSVKVWASKICRGQIKLGDLSFNLYINGGKGGVLSRERRSLIASYYLLNILFHSFIH